MTWLTDLPLSVYTNSKIRKSTENQKCFHNAFGYKIQPGHPVAKLDFILQVKLFIILSRGPVHKIRIGSLGMAGNLWGNWRVLGRPLLAPALACLAPPSLWPCPHHPSRSPPCAGRLAGQWGVG